MTPLCCVGTVRVGRVGTVRVGRVGTVRVGCVGTVRMCCVDPVRVGWGDDSLGGVNMSNVSSKYLQSERVISGSCNYPPGYHPSDPTSG